MKKMIIILVVLSTISLFSVTSVASKKIVDDSHGFFEAKIGLNDNDRPLTNLQGEYNYRGRVVIVRGTGTSMDNPGRFNGFFIGNSFTLRTPIRDEMFTIIGQFRFDEEHSSFSGIWLSRGIMGRGWITGSFESRA